MKPRPEFDLGWKEGVALLGIAAFILFMVHVYVALVTGDWSW